ncbi:hypothetical protein PAECIP111893_01472 [Paenibacillus plantiphilus]|uniref:Uncharacterized protein n=1 Tax=Paenibacillus plantiphilus TaxID=2905650 RepID=A0ABN8GBM7_9BACL|nr:S-layer homology domain-containing protein [Paenibacillus plantiphilus]CAH1200584.1 hypothetical protein PAECIP111893_01472 [Paenibacillus plantiphilus]
MGKHLKKAGVYVLALLVLMQAMALDGFNTAWANPVAPDEPYVSTIPTPQNSNLINPGYNRDYDNMIVQSSAGIVHPGYFISREDLNVMRDMIWQGKSPWKESFESFRKSAYSNLTYINSGPFTTLTSDRETYALIRDANAAYYLSLMWYITGNDDYVDKAKDILNVWSNTLATDSKRDIIRSGIAVPMLVMAAEILRYTPSSGWGSDEELQKFESMLRLLLPGVDRKDGYFNQGNFGAQAYMAIAIYLDDLDMYKDAVERIVRNQARVGLSGISHNFSIDSMILDSGQQVEMGRDIPHAQESMFPMSAMARTTYIQGTLVDETGAFKTAEEGGVNLFELYGQKLLKYAAYFSKYNLGGDVFWQPSINGTGDQAPFGKITTDGRGRIFNSFGTLLNYYKHEKGYADEDVRTDPYISDEDGFYLDLYGDSTYGSLYKYVDAAYESADTLGVEEMVTTPWTVGIGQTGAGLPADPDPVDDSYKVYNRLPGYQYTATGGTEGGVITEPFPDEDGIMRFATSNVKNGAWTAYSVDFDQFGSTPSSIADMLAISFGMNSNIGGSIDVRIGEHTANPTVNHFNNSTLAGTIQVENTSWYNIFKTNSHKLKNRPDLLTGQKTVYFYFYGSGNGYNFHGNTLWFKFTKSTLATNTKAADADLFSSAASVKNPDQTVTLSDGGYIGFKNMDFDKGIHTFNLNGKTTGGTLKLVLGSPGSAPFKEYALTSTGELMRTLTFEHGDNEQLYGRNGGNNDVYLVYEGAGSITIDSMVAKPAVNASTFQPVSGGSYAFQIEGEAARAEGKQGSVKLAVAPGAKTSVSYTDVDFLTGSPTLRVKVKSDTDAVLHVDMLGDPVGRVATFNVPKTDGLGADGWITLNFNLAATGYESQIGKSNFLRVTASSESSGTVELKDFLFNETRDYTALSMASNVNEILLYPGASYTNHVLAHDVNGNQAAVVATSKPESAAYDAQSGNLIWQVPVDEPEGKGYITLTSTGGDGVSTSVFMVQYNVLQSENYIAKLIADAINLYPIAEALAEDDYTPENWQIIVSALSNAKAITAQVSPSREDAETAYYGLKHALETALPIQEADIFGKSFNITLNNGNTGGTARNIVSIWFDGKPNTFTEWAGSNQWAMFDFGPATTFTLDRAKILARAQWGSRISGVRIEGSNNGTNWTQLTDPAANTDVLQKFFSKDAATAFRYIRVFNNGSWYANLAELKLYGTFTDLNLLEEISEVSLASSNENPTVANVGDTVSLSFKADNVIEDVNVVLYGKPVVPVSQDGLNWKAEFVVSELDTPGDIKFVINYKNGWPVEQTTDGSSVTVLEEPGYIHHVMDIASFIDSTPNRAAEATLAQVGYLFDGDIRTNSDFRGPGNNGAGWFVMDFKDRMIKLSKVKLIARQDQLARAAGTVIQGSNDNVSWTDLITGAQGIQPWQAFSATDQTAYRYLKVTNPGNWFGNLAELKLYGELAEPEAEVESIAVNSTTHKTQYVAGDELSVADLTLEVSWSNGTKTTVPVTSEMVEGFNSSAAVESQTLTIAYQGATTTYNVAIMEAPTIEGITVKSSGHKTQYQVGDTLDVTGLAIHVNWSNNTSTEVAVTTDMVSGFDSSAPADSQQLTVAYEGRTATYAITVVDATVPVVDSIAIKSTDHKTHYEVGDTLDVTGLMLEVRWSDETTTEVAATPDMVSGFDSSSAVTNQPLTVTYEGRTAAYTINIVDVSIPVIVDSIAIKSTGHKTQYQVGDTLDVTGLTLEVRWSDNTTTEVAATPDMVSGFDSSNAVSSQPLTVAYEGRTATYSINVAARPVVVVPPTTYVVSFDTNGGTPVSSLTVIAGSAVGSLPGTERNGYVFEGWYNADGTAFSASAAIYSSRTLTAKWSEQPVVPEPETPEEPVEPVEPEQPEQPVTKFADVPETNWASKEIRRLVELGAISGYGDGTFKPNASVTRAEFLKMIVLSLGLQTEGSKVFADTEGHWAQQYVSIAGALGVVRGKSDNTFAPDAVITREEMAVILARVANMAAVSSNSPFKDGGSISGWASDAIATLAEAGIMGGYPDGSFQPQNNASRAQAAAVIVRMLDYLIKVRE